MTIEAAPMVAPPSEPRGTYIGQHWRGELSLPQSYWLNGVLLSLPFRAYFGVVDAVFKGDHIEDPLLPIWWIVIPFLLMQPIMVWQGVGVWRSAGRRILDGQPGWAWAARLVVLGNGIVLMVLLATYAELTYSLLTIYKQEQAGYTLVAKKNYVRFSGLITPANADKIIEYLDKASTQRLVIGLSGGGVVYPALRVAKVVHERKLTVVVVAECDSMCAAVLAAGAKRFIFPTAAIRLHSPTWAGTNDRTPGESADLEDWYRQMGIAQELIAKMSAHAGPHDMYEPTLLELSTSGLVTDVYDKDSNLFVPIAAWCSQNMDQCSQTGLQNLKDSQKKH
jgi:hypothetical protein